MSEIKLFNSSNPSVIYPIESIRMYSDGTPMIKQQISNVDSILVRADSLNTFVTAMFLVDSLNESGRKIDFLILPYVPGARQDRINTEGDILFTAKSVAKMINERAFERVVIADPHSPVITALIDRSFVYPVEAMVKKLWQGYTGIIAPDVGAAKRAEEVARLMGKPMYQAFKHRDVSTGKLSGFSVDVPAGGHYLVVDDICDGGGTFVGLGEKIKESGAWADLFVTHGIFSKGTAEMKKYYKNVYTTDSFVANDRNDVMAFNIVNEMMEMTR